MRDVSLLIVDDALFCRDFVSFLLEDEPHIDSSCGVGTVAEALKIVQTRDFDVVTLDLGLPDAIGLDLIDSFLVADIAVIVISGDARQRGPAIARGATAFFRKVRSFSQSGIVRPDDLFGGVSLHEDGRPHDGRQGRDALGSTCDFRGAGA